jgi:hypothetical protein
MDVRARPAGLDEVRLRESFCPGCGSAVAVGLALEPAAEAAA